MSAWYISEIKKNDHKILLIVLNGVGGTPSGPNMITELQQSHKPNLNALVKRSICGMLEPIDPGRTPDMKAGFRTLMGGVDQHTIDAGFFSTVLPTVLLTRNSDLATAAAELGIRVRSDFTSTTQQANAVQAELDAFDVVVVTADDIFKQGLSGEYYDKIKAIEDMDRLLPTLLGDPHPDVVCVTGNHSTPTQLKAISWHPVPVMISSPWCRFDSVPVFDEMSCSRGGLGRIRGVDLMPLLLANAFKLKSP